MIKLAALLLLLTFTPPSQGAETSAPALAEAMRQARNSDGFSARMNVTVIQSDGHRALPFKIAVIGQIDANGQRLLIRGISPDTVRNRYFAAERNNEGRIRAIAYTTVHAIKNVDPAEPLFGSGLVLWDMLAPWWNWSQQSSGAVEQIAGRSCTPIHSLAAGNNSSIHEVISCVDPDAKLAMRTQLLDRHHNPIRSFMVKKTMRKESGALAASKLTVTTADRVLTEVEVYSGDEHYRIEPDTFAALDARTETEK